MATAVNIIPISMPNTNFIAGAVWDAQTQSIYAVDFVSPTGVNSIYRYDYNTGQIYGAQITGEQSPSFIYPVEGCDNEFVVGLLGVVKVIRWDGVSPTATVVRTLFEAYGHLNYAYAEKKGRLFTGTLNRTTFCAADNVYATYRYAKYQLTTIFTNMKITTGLINYELNKFYHGDACRYQIVELDYDCKTGDVNGHHRQVIIRLKYDHQKEKHSAKMPADGFMFVRLVDRLLLQELTDG
ncbi:uncharacterized protein LOC129564971 [Sitodiplosis mosellana]|uniref:uncharacterized protein LOC129564971 n=1 Tax=Sitodiplosis mosellana TaxID=263140 RepID=UPI002443E764|nr:uncharacterized protein LOC129564971 [Sitodiplosis mosellana]